MKGVRCCATHGLEEVLSRSAEVSFGDERQMRISDANERQVRTSGAG